MTSRGLLWRNLACWSSSLDSLRAPGESRALCEPQFPQLCAKRCHRH